MADKFCTNCAAKLMPTMLICPNCGNKSFASTPPTQLAAMPITDVSSALSQVQPKKSSSGDWIWPAIVAVVVVKLFGPVGGLVTIGGYYWLKPKLGTWGAVAASGILGIAVAIGFLAIIHA